MTLQVAAYVDGSLVPAAILRRDLWETAGGAAGEGVSTPGALAVSAQSTPSGVVDIAPGGARLLNRYITGGGQEMYSIVNDATTTLEIPASGSASSRTDYVIARIDDWHFSGAPAPADPDAQAYCRFDRVSSLSGLAYPHVPLAKIDIPSSTATVTQDMITDLRRLGNPRQDQRVIGIPAVTQDAGSGMGLTVTSEPGEYFPNGEGNTLGPADVDIPYWCTRINIRCEWLSVKYDGGAGAPFGRYWVEWGDKTGTSTREKTTQRFRFDAVGGTNERVNWIMVDDRYVPKRYRGTRQRFAPKAILDGGSGVSMDSRSGMAWTFTFMQEVDPEVAERP